MSRLISVKDHQELKKDRIVGAVINCDKDAFTTFIHKKNQRKKDQEKISLLETRIEQLESLIAKLIENK